MLHAASLTSETCISRWKYFSLLQINVNVWKQISDESVQRLRWKTTEVNLEIHSVKSQKLVYIKTCSAILAHHETKTNPSRGLLNYYSTGNTFNTVERRNAPLYGETFSSSLALQASSRKSSIRSREIRDWLNTKLRTKEDRRGHSVTLKVWVTQHFNHQHAKHKKMLFFIFLHLMCT